jgi:hypothetical protein
MSAAVSFFVYEDYLVSGYKSDQLSFKESMALVNSSRKNSSDNLDNPINMGGTSGSSEMLVAGKPITPFGCCGKNWCFGLKFVIPISFPLPSCLVASYITVGWSDFSL